jgi:hypothetical protein
MLEIRQWTFTSLRCIDKNLFFCWGDIRWVALFVNDFYRKGRHGTASHDAPDRPAMSADGDPAPFAGADPDAVDKVQNEDLPIPHLAFAGPGALVDGGDGRLNERPLGILEIGPVVW